MNESSWQPTQHEISHPGGRVDLATNPMRTPRALGIQEPMPSSRAVQPGLRISTDGMTRLLVAIIVILTLVSLAVHAATTDVAGNLLAREGNLVQLLDLDSERSLPAWYQTIALAFCGMLLVLIADAQRRQGRKRDTLYWAFLGLMFLYVSMDEMQSIHEVAMAPLRSALGIDSGFLYFAWVIPAFFLLIVATIGLVPFLRTLHPATRSRFLIAAVIFVSGAVGLELVGGYFFSTTGEWSVRYVLTSHLEEFLEMLAVVLFLRALLHWIGINEGAIAVAPVAQGADTVDPALAQP